MIGRLLVNEVGFDCIEILLCLERVQQVKQTLISNILRMRIYVFEIIGSSDKVHLVDALAMIGDEGRVSLRKAWGSWQISIDPKMSEWGNPPF